MGQKSYSQLTEGERCEIFRLRAAGVSVSEIGRMLDRNKGTISRELRRNALPKAGYLPASAERMAQVRRHARRRGKIERSSRLRSAVEDGLFAMGQSPEQIAGRLEREHGSPLISHESIYRFAHSAQGRAQGLHRYLPHAKARRGWRARKGAANPLIPQRVPLAERPEEIAARARFGDWEADLMAFSQAGQPLVVLTERTTRFTLLRRQTGKTAQATRATLHSLLADLPEPARRSITFDNGGEFARHHTLGCPTFFCDPHSPWQKGTVENTIGRLRRDLPRSTKARDFTERDLDDLIWMHNSTPRKCLGFQTPAEAFLSSISVALDL